MTDLVEAGWLHTRDVGARTRTVFERQGKWQRGHEVDIADVDEQLPAVESKLAESEVGVTVGVGRVEDRRLHEAWARVDEELETLARREPDATTGDSRHCYGDNVAWCTEWD